MQINYGRGKLRHPILKLSKPDIKRFQRFASDAKQLGFDLAQIAAAFPDVPSVGESSRLGASVATAAGNAIEAVLAFHESSGNQIDPAQREMFDASNGDGKEKSEDSQKQTCNDQGAGDRLVADGSAGRDADAY